MHQVLSEYIQMAFLPEAVSLCLFSFYYMVYFALLLLYMLDRMNLFHVVHCEAFLYMSVYTFCVPFLHAAALLVIYSASVSVAMEADLVVVWL